MRRPDVFIEATCMSLHYANPVLNRAAMLFKIVLSFTPDEPVLQRRKAKFHTLICSLRKAVAVVILS